MKKIKAVLLDRDGVINFDSPDYILSPEHWLPIPGSLEAIACLNQAGLKVAVCSNQSGLGRGMMDQSAFTAIEAKMLGAVNKAGGHLDALCYCPHHPDEGCACRKPKPGLLINALAKLGVNADEAIMVGDSLRDVQAAKAAGVKAVLVRSGYGDADKIFQAAREEMPDIQTYASLQSVTKAWLGDCQ